MYNLSSKGNSPPEKARRQPGGDRNWLQLVNAGRDDFGVIAVDAFEYLAFLFVGGKAGRQCGAGDCFRVLIHQRSHDETLFDGPRHHDLVD
ncbi:hypothetical protein [Leptolyngbya sp. 7M]|uniref:hypothetical protein n=1 Tax=Leptolyngbya sp. 7M TaxID=2812896 RepID=UPI001B8CC36E|nr:hypothetical protein [Leptolyngbya sp. 7M]QYO65700.1 hypothetical protein JVX88_02610 [Leptolyngbya sp. 7M]